MNTHRIPPRPKFEVRGVQAVKAEMAKAAPTERHIRRAIEDAVQQVLRSFAEREVHSFRCTVAISAAVTIALEPFSDGWEWGNGYDRDTEEDDTAED